MKVQTTPNKDVQKEITDLSEVRMVAVLCLPKVNGDLDCQHWVALMRLKFSFLLLSEQRSQPCGCCSQHLMPDLSGTGRGGEVHECGAASPASCHGHRYL